MLAAFQKSIESLTSRLEHETKQNEVKEQELERLRTHSSSAGAASPGAASPGHRVHTLQRHNTYNGSYSDFSDIDNENPSHFDRRRKSRKSWKVRLLLPSPRPPVLLITYFRGYYDVLLLFLFQGTDLDNFVFIVVSKLIT